MYFCTSIYFKTSETKTSINLMQTRFLKKYFLAYKQAVRKFSLNFALTQIFRKDILRKTRILWEMCANLDTVRTVSLIWISGCDKLPGNAWWDLRAPYKEFFPVFLSPLESDWGARQELLTSFISRFVTISKCDCGYSKHSYYHTIGHFKTLTKWHEVDHRVRHSYSSNYE